MRKYNEIKDEIFVLVIMLLLTTITFVIYIIQHKKYVIGIINPNPGLKELVREFKRELSGYGYVEGKNTTYIEIDNANEIASAAQDFKKKKVNLVLTITTPATVTVKKAMEGTGIPVVFGASYDPVEGGIVKSLLQHEENITGIKVGGSMQKAVEWLLKIAPKTKRIFVPVKYDTEAASLSLDELRKAAAGLDVDLVISNVETVQDLKKSLSSMPEKVDAIFIIHSIFIVSNMDMIIETAIDRKLPTGAGSGQYKNGVTISYGLDQKRSGEQVGHLVHKIFQGTPASSLPVEIADYYLGINLKTAEAIGLKIPNDILVQADFIVR